MAFLVGTWQVHPPVTAYQALALLFGISSVLSLLFSRLSGSRTTPLSKIADPTPVSPPNGIPIFGHLIGLLFGGSSYLTKLANLNPALPVAKLKSFGADFYLIQSPDAVQAAFRNQTLDIVPLAFAFLERACGAPGKFTASLAEQAARAVGKDYWHVSNKSVRDDLAGGEPLKQLTGRVLNRVAQTITNEVSTGVDRVSGAYRVSNLHEWIWTTMAMANTDALYGQATNPFRKPGLIDQYFTWEQEHLNVMYAPVLPWLTARKGYTARASVLAELTHFVETISPDDDHSVLIKNCQAVNKEHGVDAASAAAVYLGMLFGATANAFPTLYWMLLFIYSDRLLLRDLRAEIEASIICSEEDSSVKVVDASKISSASCPLLHSCYTETLRLISRQPGARIVTADTALAFKDETGFQRSYALEKGSVVHMPGEMLHLSEQNWGPSASQFDGYRFYRLAQDPNKAADRKARKAYIAVGGGKHLCPGRFMAIAEILATVAAFVAGFDIETTTATIPKMVHQFGLGIVKPDASDDLSALIRPRCDASWKFKV
ncbi:unnamed protein product [Discula destructiva]